MNLRNVILDTEHGLVKKKKGKVCVSWFGGFFQGIVLQSFPPSNEFGSKVTKVNMAVDKTHMVIATTCFSFQIGD